MVVAEASATSLCGMVAQKALKRQGEHGAISEIAREHSLSRPTVYRYRDEAIEAITERFAKGAQKRSGRGRYGLSRREIERAVIGLRVYGCNSITAIQGIMRALLDVKVGYGSVWRILSRACEGARKFLESVDLRRIRAGALDEIFAAGKPVLCGLCLDTGFLFCATESEKRSQKAWMDALAPAIRQGLELHIGVSDGAEGIKSTLRALWPHLSLREDLFHILRTLYKEARWLEHRAYRAIEKEYALATERERVRARKINGYKHNSNLDSATQKWVHARRAALEAIERYDSYFELVSTEFRRAIALIDWERGILRDTTMMRGSLRSVCNRMKALGHSRANAAALYLEKRISLILAHLDERDMAIEDLEYRWGVDAVRFAALFCAAKRAMQTSPKNIKAGARMLAAYQGLQSCGIEGVERLVAETQTALFDTTYHRASSPVESLNSRLRPHLHAHKGASPIFIPLFAEYENLRPRRSGRHKGKSPYQLLTGNPTGDWLSLIGFPPRS